MRCLLLSVVILSLSACSTVPDDVKGCVGSRKFHAIAGGGYFGYKACQEMFPT